MPVRDKGATTPAPYEELVVLLPDGYPAYARYWNAAPIRGAILYHHGIQSHCEWYVDSAAALAAAGFAVLQVDRRGCGRNPPPRGHADSAEQLVADAHAARDELLRRSGYHSYHILGVSWGGKLAVAAYLADAVGVKSLSLVTPGLFPRVGVSRDEMARIGFAMLYEPEQLFDIPLDEPELFTVDEARQDFIRTDDLTLRQCTAGFYLASRRMDRPIARLSESPPVPLHVLLAGDERITDNCKTEAFFKRLDWPTVHIETLVSARHSLEFEPDRQDYFRKLVEFIRKANKS